MNEVSCRATLFTIKALQAKKYDVDPLLKEAELTFEQVSDPNRWVSWDFFVRILEAIEQVYDKPGELETLGTKLIDDPSFKIVWTMAGFFVNPYHLYWMGSRWIGNRYFRHLQYDCRERLDGRIAFQVEFPENCPGSKTLLKIHQGTLAGLTKILGLRELAKIDATISNQRAEFIISLPSRPTFFRKARQIFGAAKAGRAAVEELAIQQEELLRSYQDLSEAHGTLQSSEQYFRSVVENVSDVVIVFTLKGRIQYVSPSVKPLIGYSPQEAMSLALEQRMSESDVEKTVELFRRATSVPGSHQVSGVQFQHKDGSWGTIDIVAKRFHSSTGEDLIITSTRDVSEKVDTEKALRHSEERLAQAQKLEAIGALAGGVAHDFNNLLQVIKGATEALNELLPPDDDELRQEVSDIEKSAQHGAELTRRLMAFTRSHMLPPQVLDLNVVVSDMARMLQRLVGESVELTVRTGTEPAWIDSSLGQTGQVILNLVINGRDAMPEGGTIVLEVDTVTVEQGSAPNRQGVRPGDYAVFIVSDTGCGMSPEVRERIFDPFFTTNPTDHSTGVGLTTVQEIVDQQGGHIVVDSDEQTGTTILAYLPLSEDDASVEAGSPRSGLSTRGSETVLLTDDDPAIRNQIRNSLEKSGYTVLEAGCGEDAIEVAREFRGTIQLLVTDLVLPDLNGLDLTKHIVGFYPEIKILFISGYTNDTFIRSSWLDPTFELLPKPFSTQEFLVKTRAILDEPGDSSLTTH